jgi:hypothetical protein
MIYIMLYIYKIMIRTRILALKIMDTPKWPYRMPLDLGVQVIFKPIHACGNTRDIGYHHSN